MLNASQCFYFDHSPRTAHIGACARAYRGDSRVNGLGQSLAAYRLETISLCAYRCAFRVNESGQEPAAYRAGCEWICAYRVQPTSTVSLIETVLIQLTRFLANFKCLKGFMNLFVLCWHLYISNTNWFSLEFIKNMPKLINFYPFCFNFINNLVKHLVQLA